MQGRAAARTPERNRLADALLSLPSERLIAFARLALAAFALAAVTVDPPADARNLPAGSVLIWAYLLYAVALAIGEFLREFGELTRLAIHAVDVLAVGLLMHLMHGPTGPFFIFFTFVLLAGTLRWNWRGAIGSALVLLIAFLLLGILDRAEPIADDQETTRMIMRGGYLLVAGAMFAYVGAYRERSLARLAALAAWPPEQGSDSGSADFSATLMHTAQVLRAQRVVVIWEEADEPFVDVSVWRDGRLRSSREPPGTYGSIVAPELSEAVFVTLGRGTRVGAIRDNATAAVSGPLVDPRLVEAFQIYGAVSAPLRAMSFEGRLFVVGPESLSDDAKLLTEIAATRIGVELEYQRVRRQLLETATVRERIRVARDIHDGVLQTLTAAGLQLKRLAQERPDDSRRLDHIRAALADQQRQLRGFVDDILKRPRGEPDKVFLDAAIRAGLENATRQWQLAMELRVVPKRATAPKKLAEELAQLLHEAAANAARHGQASKVSVVVRQSPSAITLRVHDDGAGLGVSAAEDHAGPRSIRERVAALGGQVQTRSSHRGFQLLIEVPLL